jgi:RecA/RadA recombinase
VANDIFVHNSTLALEASKAFMRFWDSHGNNNYAVLWLESESALDKVRAQYMGCDLSRFVVQEVETAEEGFKTIKLALEKAKEKDLHVFIVWDTIAAVLTEAEKATGEINTKGMGEKARLVRMLLKDVCTLLGQTDSTLFFVNQMYKNFNPYGEKDEVPGGGGIKFHASIRCLMKKVGPPIEGILSSGSKITRGIEVDLYTKKNKLTLPYQTCKLVVYGESGIDTVETLVKFLVLHKFITVKGSWKYIEFKDEEYGFQNADRLKEIFEIKCPELKIYMNYLCYNFMSSVSPLLKVKLLGKLWEYELQLYGEKKTKVTDNEFLLATLLGRELLEEQDRII